MNKRIQSYFEPFFGHSYKYDEFDPPLKIEGALYSRWGCDDYFSNKHKENTSINLVTMGNARFRQDGRSGELSPGDVFIAYKGCSQRFETGDAEFLHKRSIIISGWALDLLLERSGLLHIDVVRPRDCRHITALLRQALSVMRLKKEGFIAAASGIVYALIIELSQAHLPQWPLELYRAVAYIQQNLTNSITLADIAGAARVSVRQCNRLFQTWFKLAPMEYVNDQRMASARTMLRATSLPIKQVAVQSGFRDQFYFSAQFKKYNKVSPLNFRTQ